MVITMVTKKELVDQLNVALGMEIAAIVQYLHHSYSVMGPYRSAVADQLEKNSKDEMEHMEYVSEKIVAYDGVPTTKPADIYTAKTPTDMLNQDLAAENKAIEHYEKIIKMADEYGDTDLRKSIEDITSKEYEHKETIEKMLKM
jgi:bacterioferritin